MSLPNQNNLEYSEEPLMPSTPLSIPSTSSPPHTPELSEQLELTKAENRMSSSDDTSNNATNAALRFKIKAMQEEIADLRAIVEEKPSEREQEEEYQSEEQQESYKYIQSQNLIAHKYVELLKKSRNVNVQLYVAQDKVRKLTKELEMMKRSKECVGGNSGHRDGKKQQNKSKLNICKETFHEQKNVNNSNNDNDDDDDNNNNSNNNDVVGDKEIKERTERLYRQLHCVQMSNERLKKENIELIDVIKEEVGFGVEYNKEKILEWIRKHSNKSNNTNNKNSDNSCNGDAESNDGNVKFIRGWKGRAAQIALLQSKVKEYERALRSLRLSSPEKLECHNEDNPNDSDADAEKLSKECELNVKLGKAIIDEDSTSVITTNNNNIAKDVSERAESCRSEMTNCYTFGKRAADLHPLDYEDRTREKLAEIQGNKLAALRELQVQLSQLKTELAQEKSNNKAFQARFSNLQEECAQLRNYVKTLLDKSKTDDTLIDAYKTEIKLLQASLYKAKDEIAFYSEHVVHTKNNINSGNYSNSEDVQKSNTLTSSDEIIERVSNPSTIITSTLSNPSSKSAESVHATTSITKSDAILLEWMHNLLCADAHVKLPSPQNDNYDIIRKIVCIAHSHILRLEEEIQSAYNETLNNLVTRVNELADQLCKSHKTTSEAAGKEIRSKIVPSVDKFLITENKQLKERIRSLTELNRAEGEVLQISNHESGVM